MAISLASISGISRICRISALSGEGLIKTLLKLAMAKNGNAISAAVKNLEESDVRKLQWLLISLTARGLSESGLENITMDADSTVKSVCGHQQGAEKEYNTTRKGAKSYYPYLEKLLKALMRTELFDNMDNAVCSASHTALKLGVQTSYAQLAEIEAAATGMQKMQLV